MKVCNPNLLDEPTLSGEFDGARTHNHQSHNLARYQLRNKLHIVAPEGIEPSLTEPKPVVLPLYHRANLCRSGRTRTSEVE